MLKSPHATHNSHIFWHPLRQLNIKLLETIFSCCYILQKTYIVIQLLWVFLLHKVFNLASEARLGTAKSPRICWLLSMNFDFLDFWFIYRKVSYPLCSILIKESQSNKAYVLAVWRLSISFSFCFYISWLINVCLILSSYVWVLRKRCNR